MNYLLITSAYNEQDTIELVINSVAKQTILPVYWIIVNDGSTDKTEYIISNYVKKYNWIRLLNKKNDKIGIPGQHAMINFYYALNGFKTEMEFNFIGHLDADIILDREDYYEFLLKKMINDESLGIASGITYYMNDKNEKTLIKSQIWHTVGGLKFYRKECFEKISPIPADIGWDGIDEYKAMYQGWKTLKFYELEANHLGKSRDLIRNASTKQYYYYGKSAYRRGRTFLYLLLKIWQILKKKTMKVVFLYVKGYFVALINRESKLHSKEEIEFVRDFDRKRIMKMCKSHLFYSIFSSKVRYL